MTNTPSERIASANTLRVRKRDIPVEVTFAPGETMVATLEGLVSAQVGDAILTGVKGERWPIRADLFAAAYSPVPPTVPGQNGRYVKNPSVTRAVRLDHILDVPVGWRSDPLRARPGDWLLAYEDGSFGVIQDAIFRETYEPAPDETRWPPP